MYWIALLWLLATSSPDTRQILMDEAYSIPASDWRYVPVVLKQPPVTLECEYKVLSGGAVRVGLVNGQGLAALRQGKRHTTLASTSFVKGGRLSYEVLEPDEYAVIVDNGLEASGAAQVQLRVSLEFPGRQQPQVRQLSPARRAVVAVISLAIFLAIVTYAGKRLRAAWR
jgi:hypothetical protein